MPNTPRTCWHSWAASSNAHRTREFARPRRQIVCDAQSVHTFVHPLRRAIRVAGDREALVCGDTRLTYVEFMERLERLQTVLGELGTRPGRPSRGAGVQLDPVHRALLRHLGWRAVPGAAQLPLGRAGAGVRALRTPGARILFTDRDPGPLADLVDRVIRIDDGEYDALVAAAPRTRSTTPPCTRTNLAGLFYTGGTTGASKGVMLTHRNLIANAINMQMVMPLALDDVYLVMAPLFHAAGSVSAAAVHVRRRQARHRPVVRARRDARPRRARRSHGDARRADDGGGRGGGAAGAAA